MGRHAKRFVRKENSLAALLPHTWLLTVRLLIRWSRDPLTVFQAVVVPALFLVMIDVVLGKQITSYSQFSNPGYDALFGSVPMTMLLAAMSGSTAGAISLGRERDDGLLSRFWVLPVHRASGLLARIAAELIRIVLTTLAILGTGYVLGFRFQQGPVAALAFLLVPLLFGIAFAVLVTAVAVINAGSALVEAVALISSLLMFFSSGFVPLQAFPEWVRPIVEHQPLSLTIEAMKGLSFGGPVQGPLLGSLAWSVAAIVVFAVPATLGYQRASRR